MSALSRLGVGPGLALDRMFRWDRLPRSLGVVALIAVCKKLRSAISRSAAASAFADPVDAVSK